MGIILGSVTADKLEEQVNNLEKPRLKSIDKQGIKKILDDVNVNEDDFRTVKKVIEEIVNQDMIYVWELPSSINTDVRVNDTLYLSINGTGAFQFRASIARVIEKITWPLSEILKKDAQVCFLEDIQAIDIDKEFHLFYFGLSKRSSLSEPIYIKDTFQELSGLSEDEFNEVVDAKITWKGYDAAKALISGKR